MLLLPACLAGLLSPAAASGSSRWRGWRSRGAPSSARAAARSAHGASHLSVWGAPFVFLVVPHALPPHCRACCACKLSCPAVGSLPLAFCQACPAASPAVPAGYRRHRHLPAGGPARDHRGDQCGGCTAQLARCPAWPADRTALPQLQPCHVYAALAQPLLLGPSRDKASGCSHRVETALFCLQAIGAEPVLVEQCKEMVHQYLPEVGGQLWQRAARWQTERRAESCRYRGLQPAAEPWPAPALTSTAPFPC